jgi:hypothetical protein
MAAKTQAMTFPGGLLAHVFSDCTRFDLRRGMFAGEVGAIRLLKLFNKYDIKVSLSYCNCLIPDIMVHSWTFTGYFPFANGSSQGRRTRDWAPWVGQTDRYGLLTSNSYSHENPSKMTMEQQRDVLTHTYKQITDFCGGLKPVGYVGERISHHFLAKRDAKAISSSVVGDLERKHQVARRVWH